LLKEDSFQPCKKARERGREAGQFSELSGSFLQIKHIEYDQESNRKKFMFNWLRISKHTMTFELYTKKKTIKNKSYQAKHFSLMLMVDDVKLVKL
jgi:hypothetical protein